MCCFKQLSKPSLHCKHNTNTRCFHQQHSRLAWTWQSGSSLGMREIMSSLSGWGRKRNEEACSVFQTHEDWMSYDLQSERVLFQKKIAALGELWKQCLQSLHVKKWTWPIVHEWGDLVPDKLMYHLVYTIYLTSNCIFLSTYHFDSTFQLYPVLTLVEEVNNWESLNTCEDREDISKLKLIIWIIVQGNWGWTPSVKLMVMVPQCLSYRLKRISDPVFFCFSVGYLLLPQTKPSNGSR